MADIALCTNKECIKRALCYRYMCNLGEYQSYIEFKNICTENNNYKWLYPIDGRPIRKED